MIPGDGLATPGQDDHQAGVPFSTTEHAPGFVQSLLPRHGRRPLAFVGRALLRADNSQAARDGVRTEWSDIRIFELPESGFAAAIRHLRAEDGLPRWQDAWLAVDASTLLEGLRHHDPDVPGEPSRRAAWADLLHAIFGNGRHA